MASRKPRALGYIRVSTIEQVSGSGLDVQRDALRDHCRREGLRLVDVLSDEGVSGSNGFDTREGLADALDRCERGDAEVLLVYRYDRLARDLIVQETTIERLAQHEVQVVSVTEPEIEGDDATRTLVRQVLGAISQYERAVIRARMASGKRKKAESGGYVGGRPAYGFKAVGGDLVADKAEAEVVARIKREQKAGASLRAIAEGLNADGVPAPGTTKKKPTEWHPNTVRRIADKSVRTREATNAQLRRRRDAHL